MGKLRFTVALPMFEPAHLVPLAATAEEAGFDSVALPESVFYPEHTTAAYPYTADGSRFWTPETPFVDPFVAIPAMAAVTSTLRFYTNVVKLPLRNPLLVAKQVSTIAVLSGNRFALGVGLSWQPEEFRWTHTEKRTRGVRTDEAIEILKLVCAGSGPRWVEYHGTHYDFDRLMISPAPEQPVPVWVGGHSEPSLRRAARLGDGWISVNTTTPELAEAITQLRRFRSEYGRSDVPFAVSVLAIDAFDLDAYRRLGEIGVTHVQVVPLPFTGNDDRTLQKRREYLRRFADDILGKIND